MSDEDLVAQTKADPKKPRVKKASTAKEMLDAMQAAGEKIDPDTATELQALPGFSRGVRANSAVRMLKLGKPICPFSKVEYEKDNSGNIVPIPENPEKTNCQRIWPIRDFGTQWVQNCIDRGHDPFYRTIKWYSAEDELIDLGDGRMRKVGEILIPHEVKVPNIAQTAVSPRINNGEGALRAIRGKGFRRLRDIGFEEVCQFRNCQKAVDPEFSRRRHGAYCSREHLLLIAADDEGELLHQPNDYLNGPEYPKVVREREKQLQQISVYTQVV